MGFLQFEPLFGGLLFAGFVKTGMLVGIFDLKVGKKSTRASFIWGDGS